MFCRFGSGCVRINTSVCGELLPLAEQAFDVFLVWLGNQGGLAEMAFTFGALLFKDVALVGLTSLELARSGGLKALGRALMGFHLWHVGTPLVFCCGRIVAGYVR